MQVQREGATLSMVILSGVRSRREKRPGALLPHEQGAEAEGARFRQGLLAPHHPGLGEPLREVGLRRHAAGQPEAVPGVKGSPLDGAGLQEVGREGEGVQGEGAEGKGTER